MGYIKKSDKTKREYAIEALEILKQEGVDITKIAPRRSFKGVKRYILLKEVRCDRIDEIIKKYDLDPNLPLGSQIYIMRTKIDSMSFADQIRIMNLGVKKSNVNLGNSSGENFRNQIHETLFILEALRKEGVDTAFIPQIVKGNTSHLKDIDSPETPEIIKKLGLSEDLPIGRRISTVISEYSPNNKRHYYKKSEEDMKMIRNVEIMNSFENNVDKTMTVLRTLKELGIDITSIKRYLYEIEDPKINQTIEELKLPKFYLIGKRLNQVKTYILSEKYPEEKRKAIKDQLIEWDLFRERRENGKSELSTLEKEQKDLEKLLKEAEDLNKKVNNELESKKSKR